MPAGCIVPWNIHCVVQGADEVCSSYAHKMHTSGLCLVTTSRQAFMYSASLVSGSKVKMTKYISTLVAPCSWHGQCRVVGENAVECGLDLVEGVLRGSLKSRICGRGIFNVLDGPVTPFPSMVQNPKWGQSPDSSLFVLNASCLFRGRSAFLQF